MLINGRTYFRLRRHIDLYWKVDVQKFGQKGKILDLSLSGLKMEIFGDLVLKSTDKNKTIIYLNSAEIPNLPAEGKIRWFKPISDGKGYVCGISFIKPSSGYPPQWRKWMEDNIAQLADAADNKIIGNYLDFEKDPDIK
jgi:hypothetical protein